MPASKPDLFAVLRQYNPWWAGGRFPDLPSWRRAAFREIAEWVKAPTNVLYATFDHPLLKLLGLEGLLKLWRI